MGEKKLTQQETDALDRRDREWRAQLMDKINRIEETTQANCRALRGYNGTPGLVAQMSEIREIVSKVEDHEILLHGNPRDVEAVSMVQEQRLLRRWVKDVKAAVSKIQFWVYFLLGGLILETLFSHFITSGGHPAP